MESKKLFFLIQNRMYGDGVRSALGQAVENHYAYPVFMYEEYPPLSDYMKENMEWVVDMEGEVFTVAEKQASHFSVSGHRAASSTPAPHYSQDWNV